MPEPSKEAKAVALKLPASPHVRKLVAAALEAFAAERGEELIANDKAIQNIAAGYRRQLKAASDYADAALKRAEAAEERVRVLEAALELAGTAVTVEIGVHEESCGVGPCDDIPELYRARDAIAKAEPVLLASTTTYCHTCDRAVDMPHEHEAAPEPTEGDQRG